METRWQDKKFTNRPDFAKYSGYLVLWSEIMRAMCMRCCAETTLCLLPSNAGPGPLSWGAPLDAVCALCGNESVAGPMQPLISKGFVQSLALTSPCGNDGQLHIKFWLMAIKAVSLDCSFTARALYLCAVLFCAFASRTVFMQRGLRGHFPMAWSKLCTGYFSGAHAGQVPLLGMTHMAPIHCTSYPWGRVVWHQRLTPLAYPNRLECPEPLSAQLRLPRCSCSWPKAGPTAECLNNCNV